MVASTVAEADAIEAHLGGRSFEDWFAQYQRDGYVIFERVLPEAEIERQRAALQPWLDTGPVGRNEFEGTRSNRVYAMLAKDPVFADLVLHPLPMAFAEHVLGPSLLLSACLAINLHPGETAQPWHFDDAHLTPARPREAFGVSTFWAIDDCTVENGATEVLPGSHVWGDGESEVPEQLNEQHFAKATAGADDQQDRAAHPDAVQAVMPSGSLMVAAGTLWHRGGANRSDGSRLIVTPQYCPGWSRQLESMLLAVPPAKAKSLPKRAQELLGYSIHPPFMGYADGRHPARVLDDA